VLGIKWHASVLNYNRECTASSAEIDCLECNTFIINNVHRFCSRITPTEMMCDCNLSLTASCLGIQAHSAHQIEH
jgi:hypothetical protein